MKDIKQYFVGAKMLGEEIAADSENDVELQEDEIKETIAKGKRKRVKIRISRLRDSKERMCDIIENKNDLIDKTPSPFNTKVNNGENTLQDGTPKSHLSTVDLSTEQMMKDPKLAAEMNKSLNLTKIKNVLQDKKKLNVPIIIDLDNNSNDIKDFDDENVSEIYDIESHDTGSQREESNAFQVLMNRNKPIQYKSVLSEPIEEELKEKIIELKSKRKEKLMILADKKGYSKRKLAELEEAERIEKNIEDRMKFFKDNSKNDVIHKKDDDIELSLRNNKQVSGNLLHYFSKSPLKSANEDIKCMSTFIVKADVHRTDNSDTEPVLKLMPNKTYSNKRSSKSELDLSTADDIHIIASENIFSPQITDRNKQKQEKPRWSLRIKLQSSGNNDCTDDSTDDELFSPRSKVKLNTSNKFRNFINTEHNEICMKNPNGYKIKLQNNEKKELIDNERNVLNITKDIVNNGDVDICPRKSYKTTRTKQKLNITNETVMSIDDDECEIINENILKRKPNEKLAPLFIKRRRTDPTTVAARRLFLQSDITNVENKSADRKSNNNNTYMLPFPVISHVTQLKNKSDSSIVTIKHKFRTKVEREYSPSIDINNYKCISNYNEVPKTIKTVNEHVKENIDQVLSEIEKICPEVQRMWNSISIIKGKLEKKSQTRSKKEKSLERKKMLMESINNENQSHDCMWTCKYKPTSMQDIVGNEEAAKKLKNWLTGWRVSLTKTDDGSSDDEFYSSDCSSSYNNENNQIAVLLGPHGSGKSASVYAIAEELGYSVLEVNASSRRTGKKILKELEEATKSHRIKKNKHKPLFDQTKSEESKILQNSLILLEDVDLIFEEDEGFISAAYQLASNTKRPIVMTCRDTCPHLNKMAPQQNKIYFQKVNGSRASALLELISLAETGYRIPHNYLIRLLQAGDLRQALLQFQYLLMSGPSILSEQFMTAKSSFWQDTRHCIYKPAIKLSRKQKTTKDTNIKKSKNMHIINNLADDLDDISLISSLIDIEDTILDMSKESVQPNLSLAENISFYSISHDLNMDIACFISDRILYKNLCVDKYIQNQNSILRKQLSQEVDLALSNVTSVCLDQRIIALDYLPTVRTICRAEESRCTIKRGNRFFHYLHGLKVPTALMKPNILATACRMLQEKVDKTASADITNVVSK